MYSKTVVERVLREVHARKVSPARALSRLKNLTYEVLRSARLDHHRLLRKGLPEAIYAPGKSVQQLIEILTAMQSSGARFVVTRLEEARFRDISARVEGLAYSPVARLAYPVLKKSRLAAGGSVMVISGGTSDTDVAEEAALSLEVLGHRAVRAYDCGVAGLHRLLDQLARIRKADVLICVAGMEGALPSVVAGLCDKPVIAVPTAVGYGSHFEGLASLLTMLNSCAQGIAVVNIGNGYGAACMAHLILQAGRKRTHGHMR